MTNARAAVFNRIVHKTHRRRILRQDILKEQNIAGYYVNMYMSMWTLRVRISDALRRPW
jgi:hypothetical protein